MRAATPDAPTPRTRRIAINVSYFVGTKFAEATAYTDFTVQASENGESTSLDATISYDVAWAGGWFLAGLFSGWNDAKSEIFLTVRDLTAGTVVRTTKLHDMEPDGFIGIDIIDAGTAGRFTETRKLTFLK